MHPQGEPKSRRMPEEIRFFSYYSFFYLPFLGVYFGHGGLCNDDTTCGIEGNGFVFCF